MQFAESGRVPTVRVRVESESACLESESRCEGPESESSKIGTRVRLESESKDSSPHLCLLIYEKIWLYYGQFASGRKLFILCFYFGGDGSGESYLEINIDYRVKLW